MRSFAQLVCTSDFASILFTATLSLWQRASSSPRRQTPTSHTLVSGILHLTKLDFLVVFASAASRTSTLASQFREPPSESQVQTATRLSSDLQGPQTGHTLWFHCPRPIESLRCGNSSPARTGQPGAYSSTFDLQRRRIRRLFRRRSLVSPRLWHFATRPTILR